MSNPLSALTGEPASSSLAVLAAALAALLAAVNSTVGTTLPERMRGRSQPGGARIPGTSFELAPSIAAQAMTELLQGYGDATFAQRFAERLAQKDAASRVATGFGETGPLMAEVLAVCGTGFAMSADATRSAVLVLPHDVALTALTTSLATQFRPEEAKRVLACFENPQALSAMPVRDFIALLVRL